MWLPLGVAGGASAGVATGIGVESGVEGKLVLAAETRSGRKANTAAAPGMGAEAALADRPRVGGKAGAGAIARVGGPAGDIRPPLDPDALIGFFADRGRDLPWRDPTATPWAVLVSEVMLQQTPVVRVLPVYDEWLRRWPTPADLAADSVATAIRLWGRLGYPRRALRLHAAAATITLEHEGFVPNSIEELLRLPGIGEYTARAVAAFAFGARTPVVDTNVRRVLSRVVRGLTSPANRPVPSTATRWSPCCRPNHHERHGSRLR